MPARAKKGFSLTEVHDFVPFKFSASARLAVATEIERKEKPADVEAAVLQLEATCTHLLPWARRHPPSVTERKAGLKKAAKLAMDLHHAIRDDGLFGKDWYQIQGPYSARFGIGHDLNDLQRRLFNLAALCTARLPDVKKEAPRVGEPFDAAADWIGMFYQKVLLTTPVVSKRCSYLTVLKICCQELRGKRTTEKQVQRHALNIAALAKKQKNRAEMPGK